MSWRDTVRTGFEAIRTHRLRSALTMLGILIGIAAVILTVGLGEGAQAKVSAQIDSLGTNLLVVTPGSATSATGVRGGAGTASTLTVADATALGDKAVAPDIAAVAPSTSAVDNVVAGATNWTTSVIGTTPSWLRVRGRSLAAGRFLSAADERTDAAVAVLGPVTAEQLFGLRSPLGRTVTVGGVPFTVVGELTSAGAASSATAAAANQDDEVIVPLSTAAARLFGATAGTTVQSIDLEATSASTISAAYQEASAELSALHGLTNPLSPDFTIATQQSLLSTATSVSKTLTVLLGGVAALSLLVGGIGVMNIMLVSVTERVREIGLRKALGATSGAIRRQFLVEASTLGLAGGLVGAAIGVAGAKILPRFLANPVVVSPPAAVGAVVVAMAIGVGFGVYPASRAARLSPIDALRSE